MSLNNHTPFGELPRPVDLEEEVLPHATHALTGEDLVVEVASKGGFEAAGSAIAVVVLHAQLDDDLREEGLAREILARLQTGRKEADLGYTDRITVCIQGDAAVVAAVTRFAGLLQAEALATALSATEDVSVEGRLDDRPFAMRIAKAG